MKKTAFTVCPVSCRDTSGKLSADFRTGKSQTTKKSSNRRCICWWTLLGKAALSMPLGGRKRAARASSCPCCKRRPRKERDEGMDYQIRNMLPVEQQLKNPRTHPQHHAKPCGIVPFAEYHGRLLLVYPWRRALKIASIPRHAVSFGALALSTFVPVHTMGLTIFMGLVRVFLCTLF